MKYYVFTNTATYSSLFLFFPFASSFLKVWDHGAWYEPTRDWEAHDSILAIKVAVDPSAMSAGWTEVEWGGVVLPLRSTTRLCGESRGPGSQWTMLMPQAVSQDREVAAIIASSGATQTTQTLTYVCPPPESLGGFEGQQAILTKVLAQAARPRTSTATAMQAGGGLRRGRRSPSPVGSSKSGAMALTSGGMIGLDAFEAKTAGAAAGATAQPAVIISGAHISANPTPATGIARAIRLRYPDALVTGLGDRNDKVVGVNDAAFSRGIAVSDGMGLQAGTDDATSREIGWRLVKSLLREDPAALYIPGTDADVDRLTPRMGGGNTKEEEDLEELLGRVLCPTATAVELTEKPGIVGAAMMGRQEHEVFSIPEFFTFGTTIKQQSKQKKNRGIPTDSVAKTDVEDWCKRNGYPVIVKGMHQGAGICNRWEEVTNMMTKLDPKAGGYVQKHIVGFQMGIAYCAVEGELTAALMMEKSQYMGTKAWGGELRPVPAPVLHALDKFCRETRWTGGGELGYIEDLEGKLHAIDWNPRFPAWIFASSYTGCNLPAALVQHALHVRARKSNNAAALLQYPDPRQRVQQAALTARVGFSRTIIEVPSTLHYQAKVDGGFVGLGGYAGGKGSAGACGDMSLVQLPASLMLEEGGESEAGADKEARRERYRCRTQDHAQLELAGVQEQGEEKTYEGPGKGINKAEGHWGQTKKKKPLAEARVIKSERAMRQRELRRLLPVDPAASTQTPRFVLSLDTVRESLLSHKNAVETAMAAAGSPCEVDMCLSVKTQPHIAVLKEARECGYRGEVITFAEMRGCLAAGWAPEEIVVNGPGKLYDGYAEAHTTRVESALGAVYADSLADLETIVRRVKDPQDWLDARVIGLRLAPFWTIRSRFGIDSSDPEVLARAAQLLNKLPEDRRIGFHTHYASSVTGVEHWFCLANGFVRAVKTLSTLLLRAPTQLDFGGGWPAHVLNQPQMQGHLVDLFRNVGRLVPTVQTVSFELGKCVSERAGGLLTKVLEVREGRRKIPKECPVDKPIAGQRMAAEKMATDKTEAFPEKKDAVGGETKVVGAVGAVGAAEIKLADAEGAVDSEDQGGGAVPRGVVVDACISDLGSMPTHVHPVLWYTDKAAVVSGEWESESNPAEKKKAKAWSQLPVGKDTILGSICMEFDVLAVGVEVPANAKAGDHLLIAYTGSYDATMAYDFADAKGRDFLLLDGEGKAWGGNS